ncbi:potassium voltage-gated channel subfamily S member 3-like [Gigantopelta aegis]|uniref:potassium voltage-gated channel subfamily S member 3-like n=1 Tax=Gigantopelta aegis TaxID=1735272 RepID=UPI001B88D37D|nr:potassium voltage-gated channel subfamily S member 3-like [Gigantopelta aegis]
MDVIRLNVSGKRFLIKRETLLRYPGTRLAELGTSSPEYNPSTKDYYFDRNSKLVPFILDLYRTGELHLPQNFCPSAIKVELLFWGIPEDAISDCCWKLYFRHAKDMNIFHVIRNALRSLSPDSDVVVDSLRQKIWLTMSVPDYSFFAKLVFTPV